MEDLGRRLERWLGSQLPDGIQARLSSLSIPPTNGMSSETLLFDATWRESGGERTEELVARLAPEPSAVPVFPVYDLPRQFEVMRLVAAHSVVPVPKVFWCEPSPAAMGTPFFVMERVEGQVPPDIMPYSFGDSWLSRASAEEQRTLQDASVAVLVELHAIEEAESRFGFLRSIRPGDTSLRRHVAEQWAYYEWAREGWRSPLLERCFEWLDAHWPTEGPTVLSWGDARIGNVLYRDFLPVAVLDWEMAALAPRGVDIGWMVYLHRFFDDLAAGYGLPGMPHFMRREDVAATYESLSGYTPRDLDWFTMFAATRHGIISIRTSTRSIHFGEREMPDDVDDLIMHRTTLEQMLAGTYWR